MTAQLTSAQDALAQVMAYYGREITQLEAMAWGKVIQDFGDEPVVTFLLTHMESSTFAPKVGEIMNALNPGRRNSTAAYEAVARAVREQGPYNVPKFDDPAIAGAIVLMGGWLAVNETMPEVDGSFESNAFIKRFEAMYAQSCADVMLRRNVRTELRSLHDVSAPAGLLGHSQGLLERSAPGVRSAPSHQAEEVIDWHQQERPRS